MLAACRRSGAQGTVAMPLHKELGLDDGGPTYKVGTGSPIPEKWDPSRVGVKY